MNLEDQAREKLENTISLDDFLAHMPDHKYIFIPTRDLWPAISVDASIEWPDGPDGKMKPSRWLDANQSVEQMTWAPGLPLLTMWQSYHLVHHLYPRVPFYRYGLCFDDLRPDLEEHGARIDYWWGTRDT